MAKDNAQLVLGALVNLGYSRGEAKRAVEQLDDTERPLEPLLREALAYARGDEPKGGRAMAKGAKGDAEKTKRSAGNEARGGGFLARARDGVAKLPPAVKWGAGGILAGGLLAVLAGRVGRAASGDAPAPNPEPKPAPPPAAPAKQTARSGATLTVTTKGKLPARLRASASPTAPVLGYVPAGSSATVEDSATGTDGAIWYRVALKDGRSGWIHGDILA
jgi:hypothetical protein